MPLFLCRWPNGDCSVVLARTKEDAIIELDQVGNAEDCPITQVRRAVEQERNRLDLEETATTEPQTGLGRDVKSRTDMPTILIDRLVRKRAAKKLRNFKGRGKPSRVWWPSISTKGRSCGDRRSARGPRRFAAARC